MTVHPFECGGPGECVHCARLQLYDHNPATCALCDPEYDGSPNIHWPARIGDADRAFGLWCAPQGLVEDRDTPHGEAFYAGYEAGRASSQSEERA